MTELKIKILDKKHNTIAAGKNMNRLATLIYSSIYEEGDLISIELNQCGLFCEVQLDEAMKPAILFISGDVLYFKIPFEEMRSALSPKAFHGSCHVITARILEEWEVKIKRNLALNPYDGFLAPGIFPHADANVETRNEAVFAARNAIDGIYANHSHGKFPYGSWGINQQEDAEWKLEFGQSVLIDELRLTLRADYPHDNYWKQAAVEFSDGSIEVIELSRLDEPQAFKFEPKTVSWLILKNLIKSNEISPFPALTQFEAIGHYI